MTTTPIIGEAKHVNQSIEHILIGVVLKIITSTVEEIVLDAGVKNNFIQHEENFATSIIGRCSRTNILDSFSDNKINCYNSDKKVNYSDSFRISLSDNDSKVNRCYQCILCTPMFFQSKKKRLWRARVTQPSTYSGQQCQSNCTENCSVCFRTNSTNCQLHSTCNHMSSIVCQNLCNGCENFSNVYCYETGKCSNDMEANEQNFNTEICQRVSTVVNSAPQTSTTTTGTNSNLFGYCCGTSYSSSQRNLSNNTIEEKDFFRALIGKLKESQLTTLCHAIENGSTLVGQQPDCVLLPRGNIMGEEPNLIACRLWRWPDLKSATELKSIPSCPSEKDPVYICCNPSHWSRLCRQDVPPPPYQQDPVDRILPKAQSLSENVKSCFQIPESLTTDGEEVSTSSWCQLAYWELAQRVGGRFPVENPSVNVFSDQPRGDGVCLKTLAEQRQSVAPKSVLKARQKIGLGVTLSQEWDGVWLYNRSTEAVFVHSPTLNDIDCWSNVSKIPPGYCIRAFDYRAAFQPLTWSSQIYGLQTGPVDRQSMRISFAKGWGPKYSRQDVTACPCWLEVLFPRR